VSDYGLDDRAIGVRSPTENFYSNLCAQTRSGTHPASCTMGTGGPIPEAKARPGRDADHSPPSSAEVRNEQELYSSPPSAFVECSGTALLCFCFDLRILRSLFSSFFPLDAWIRCKFVEILQNYMVLHGITRMWGYRGVIEHQGILMIMVLHIKLLPIKVSLFNLSNITL
jgi:hypothetical protein